MTTRRTPWLSLATATTLMFAASTAWAEEPHGSSAAAPQTSSLAGLLDLITSANLPSLSGLIQPETMGMLTDNKCRISDNEAELELLSNNTANLLSGIRILSDIKVNVNISVGESGNKAGRAEADKPDAKPKADKRRSRKVSRRSKVR